MHRSTLTQVAAASAALVAGSIWLESRLRRRSSSWLSTHCTRGRRPELWTTTFARGVRRGLSQAQLAVALCVPADDQLDRDRPVRSVTAARTGPRALLRDHRRGDVRCGR